MFENNIIYIYKSQLFCQLSNRFDQTKSTDGKIRLYLMVLPCLQSRNRLSNDFQSFRKLNSYTLR